jgi:hypothetical protein
MRRAGPAKSIAYGLVVAIGMSFLFHEVAFSASRSLRRSGKFRGPAMHSQHRFVSPFRSDFGVVLGRGQGLHRVKDPFHSSGFKSRFGDGFGFIGGHVVDAGDVVIIQVPSSASKPSREPGHTGTYVYPQWVDGGHGVEILRPGYWSDAKQRVEEER